jgi:hypothetical protein
MRGSFDTMLIPAPPKSLEITAAPSAPPSDEDVWLDRCFDDLTNPDDDMEEDNDFRVHESSDETAAAVPNAASWMFTNNNMQYHPHHEQDNALVPSLQMPQQLMLVIPFSQLRDSMASREAVGSIVARDDPACTGKNLSAEKRQLNPPVALIEWNGSGWPMY